MDCCCVVWCTASKGTKALNTNQRMNQTGITCGFYHKKLETLGYVPLDIDKLKNIKKENRSL